MKLIEYIKFNIAKWQVKRFWDSKKGIALTHKVFDMYKESPLYKNRRQFFSAMECVELFTWDEFVHFRSKAMDDPEIRFTIFREPDKILDELREKDWVLKSHVKF